MLIHNVSVASSIVSTIPVFYANAINSLVHKVPLLKSCVLEYRPMILLVTETWASEVCDSFALGNYVHFRCDRTSTAGGGVIYNLRAQSTTVISIIHIYSHVYIHRHSINTLLFMQKTEQKRSHMKFETQKITH